MTPEQSMRIYLTECALHAEVLVEGLRDAYSWMPLSADRLADKTLLRIFGSNRLSIYKIARFDGEKILPLILVLAQEPILSSATFAEKLNRLERLGAIPSVEEWKSCALPVMPLRKNIRMILKCGLLRLNDFWTGRPI